MRIIQHLPATLLIWLPIAAQGVEMTEAARLPVPSQQPVEARMWTPSEIGTGAFSLQPDKTLVYKTVSSKGQPVGLKLDMFLPPGHQSSDQRPAIVFFHGGGWYGGGNGQFYSQCRYLALRGMVAIAAEYRCINDFKTTPKECVKDGKSAVRWIRQHAPELGIDPKRIAAGGESAGGHVAAATALAKGFEEEGEDQATSCRPDALVLFNPVFDNGPGGFGYGLVKDYWKDFSPIDNIDGHAPPAIVILGTKDEFIPVETGKRFERQMKEKGVRCDLHLYEGKPHGFFNIWNGKEDLAITLVEVDRFLASLGYLKGEPTLKLEFHATAKTVAPNSPAVAGTPERSAGDLKAGFTTPPPEARPRFYWFWLGGTMSKDGIRADLEAMHDVGIGGVLMMNAYPTAPLNITCMGDKWWDLLTYANTEAKRQGILFGTHNCPGWSTSGGPWNAVENSMQKVVFSEQTVEGPGTRSLSLARPEVDPKWNYYRDIAVLAVKNAKSQPVPATDIIDLSGQMDAQGLLKWQAPEGKWTVYRFGHTTTGHMNGPPIEGGQGLECDKMSREATKIHFEGYAKKIVERLRPLVGENFHNFELDSYEADKQNWTPKFREEFKKRRGYDPVPWLPVLAGCTPGSADQTARFTWDMDKTISDLYVENHYQYLAELARQEGVGMDYEAYGGPFDPLGAGGAADMPMGEGWTGSGGWGTVKLAVSAAHTHGRPLIGCEALTSTPVHSQWKQTPYSIKAFADQAFSLGINMLVLHCYAQQPWEHVRPGMTMNFWGTQFSRTQTWWDFSRPWFDYIARCQFLLQRGIPVVDLCILGTGNPGAIPAGCKADFCNDETLSRMTVENGDLVLPGGMRYRLLLLPGNRQIPMQSLKEIDRLVKAGASIAGPRPDRIPGLTNYPDEDRELQKIAGTIWGNCDGNTVKETRHEKGHVFWNLPISEALARLGTAPDVSFHESRSGEGVPSGTLATGIEFNHRSSKDAEIYFISNQEDCFREVVASFRASGKRPSFWYPDTGKVEPVSVYEERDGRVSIPLRLPPSASLFVVFQDTAGDDHLTGITRTPGKDSRPPVTLQPLRIAKATAISKDKKTFVDLTAKVQALAQSGILRITPEVFHQLTADLANVERISVNYLVEDDWHTRYAHPSGTLQIPEGVPLSRDADYEVSTPVGGKTSMTVREPGTYKLQWASGKSSEINVDAAGTSLPLNKDWTVSFKPGLGAPESVRLPELDSLSRHEIPGVKFYSGISTYEKAFSVPAEMMDPTQVTRLDLGQVKSVAEVILNGHNLGILWKPPFQVDVTGLLRAGENHLQIKVANNWPNRMIGDEQEPEDCNWSQVISWPHDNQQEPVGRSLSGIPAWVINKTPRPSPGRVTFSTWKFFNKDSPLLDSGLLGPVRLETEQRFTLEPPSTKGDQKQ